MSKVGRSPITLPSGTTLTEEGRLLTVTGPKGTLTFAMPKGISVSVSDDTITLTRESDAQNIRALHGVVRANLANMVKGVTTPFSKTLELVGTGYRARLQGTTLVLSLGFSHEVNFATPEGLTITVEGTNLINITGISRQAVGQAAAKIRALRPPEPYKGKGIRYLGEVVRKKAGKAAKAGAAA